MKQLLYILPLLLLIQCRERYDVPFDMPQTGFLVVEGFINVVGETDIKLSRTTKLTERDMVHETGATVTIEGDDNSEYLLPESDSGVYAGLHPALNPNTQYRVRIKAAGKEYLSTFSNPIKTPGIDSINWIRSPDRLEIFVNAHDINRSTNYYKWDYEETWEIRSAFSTSLKFNIDNSVSPAQITVGFANSNHLPDESILKCWKTRVSSNINIATTIKLSEDRVYMPLIRYPQGSWELGNLYSINVKQYALSRGAFEFYDKMKKNTESVGSVFDRQPSESRGNITCLDNPKEIVVGYLEPSMIVEKRLFISNNELPEWGYAEFCEETGYYVNNVDSVFKDVYTKGLMPTRYFSLGLSGNILSFFAAPSLCVDCTLRGESQKPSFWP